MPSDNEILQVVFAIEKFSDSGEEQLLLVNFDKNAKVLDYLTVADYESPAECEIISKTIIRKTKLHHTHKQVCALLDDSGAIGQSTDSTITTYELLADGHFKSKEEKSGRMEKLDD